MLARFPVVGLALLTGVEGNILLPLLGLMVLLPVDMDFAVLGGLAAWDSTFPILLPTSGILRWLPEEVGASALDAEGFGSIFAQFDPLVCSWPSGMVSLNRS